MTKRQPYKKNRNDFVCNLSFNGMSPLKIQEAVIKEFKTDITVDAIYQILHRHRAKWIAENA